MSVETKEKRACNQINNQLLRFFIGLIGCTLGLFTFWISQGGPNPPYERLPSLSHSYHYWDNSQNFFVGALSFIAIGLMTYRGNQKTILGIREAILSKIAGASLLVVAFVPANFVLGEPNFIHTGAAALVFFILILFCFCSFRRQALLKYKKNNDILAKCRACVYTACGLIMIFSILAIAIDRIIGLPFVENVLFFGESIALSTFGFVWLVASKVVGKNDERLRVSEIMGVS